MKKKKFNPAIIIIPVVVIVLVVLVAVMRKVQSSVNNVTYVTVTDAKKDNIKSVVDTTGTIGSEINMEYISPVNAKVASVNVSVGQAVKAGDSLLTYDIEDLQEAYDLASLQNLSEQASTNNTIHSSDESAEKARDAERRINEYNSKIDSKKSEIDALKNELANFELSEADRYKKQQSLEDRTLELQELQAQLEGAKAEKEAAQAGIMSEDQRQSLEYSMKVSGFSVTDAENNLNTAKAGIVAEYDGIVTEISVTSGSMASQGQTMIVIARTSDMKVDFSISKYDLADIELGQKVAVKVLGHDYEGTVSSISKVAVTQQSGLSSAASAAMVPAQVHIDNPDDKLVIGIDAELSITTGESSDAVVVPAATVNQDKEGTFVYSYGNGKVVRKEVKVGIISDEYAEILEGISEGDPVVTEVDMTIKDGLEAETLKAKDTGKDKEKDSEDSSAEGVAEEASSAEGAAEETAPANEEESVPAASEASSAAE